MSNLKINDYEFIFAEKVIHTYLENLIKTSSSYLDTLKLIIEESLKDKEISSNFLKVSEDMTQIISLLEEAQKSLDGKSKNFIEKIDEIDKFIY